MNTLPHNGPFSDANRRDSSGTGEDTLRLIASLPAPEGLADRVKAGLRSAPELGRILMWRGPLNSARGWMHTSVARGAAAAAIVCVVAGGGWRIYSRVQPGPSANVMVMPTPGEPTNKGFSPSTAPRVPDTPGGVKLTQPVQPAPEVDVLQKMPAQPKAVARGRVAQKKKSPSRPTTVQ